MNSMNSFRIVKGFIRRQGYRDRYCSILRIKIVGSAEYGDVASLLSHITFLHPFVLVDVEAEVAVAQLVVDFFRKRRPGAVVFLHGDNGYHQVSPLSEDAPFIAYEEVYEEYPDIGLVKNRF